jgi:hypothetical protein
MVYRIRDIEDHPDISLTRGGMILIGLLSGGDYQQGGLSRCGIVTAHGLARCGFGDTLFQAAVNLTREQLRSIGGTNFVTSYAPTPRVTLAESIPPSLNLYLMISPTLTSSSLTQTPSHRRVWAAGKVSQSLHGTRSRILENWLRFVNSTLNGGIRRPSSSGLPLSYGHRQSCVSCGGQS